jgi:hypothetical protein
MCVAVAAMRSAEANIRNYGLQLYRKEPERDFVAWNANLNLRGN